MKEVIIQTKTSRKKRILIIEFTNESDQYHEDIKELIEVCKREIELNEELNDQAEFIMKIILTCGFVAEDGLLTPRQIFIKETYYDFELSELIGRCFINNSLWSITGQLPDYAIY